MPITNPVKAIRAKCLDCSVDNPYEVRDCPVTDCALYPFRFGKNPFRKVREMTEEEKVERASRFLNNRASETETH